MNGWAGPTRVVFGAVAAMLVACASTTPPPPPASSLQAQPPALTPTERLRKARDAFRAGDFATAVEQYDEVLAKDPTDTTALYNKGVALQRAGELDAAQAAYEAALEANPDDRDAVLNLGAVKRDLGAIDAAIALYRKALEQDEFNARLLNNLALLYREKGQPNDAIMALRKVLMRDRNNVDAYKNLALVYFEQKNYPLSRIILDSALQMAERQRRVEPDIYVNLGRVYVATGDHGKAMAAFKRAVELEPGHVVANYNIGALALAHRDYQTAKIAYEVCAEAWPERYDVWASLGYSNQGLQAYSEAEGQLAKSRRLLLSRAKTIAEGPLLEKLTRENEQMLYQLVSTAQSAEQNHKALQYAEEYLRLTGGSCSPDAYDGFCGRYNGIKLVLESSPPSEPEVPKPAVIEADDATTFTDGEKTEDDAEVERLRRGKGAEGDPADGR